MNRNSIDYRNREPKGSSIAKEEESILNSFPQLISDDYRGWCVIRLREIGKREFVRRAERAIKYGHNPQKLFIHLIK